MKAAIPQAPASAVGTAVSPAARAKGGEITVNNQIAVNIDGDKVDEAMQHRKTKEKARKGEVVADTQAGRTVGSSGAIAGFRG
jgi:hypothetical protein